MLASAQKAVPDLEFLRCGLRLVALDPYSVFTLARLR